MGTVTEIVAPDNSVAIIIHGIQGMLGVDENVILDQNLGTVASINCTFDGVEVVVVNAGDYE